MKAKIVYGSPCSGKTTYVRNNASNSDLIFDYDRLLVAATNRTLHFAEKHALHWLILDLRKSFVEAAKLSGDVENFWMVCSWNTDYIKELFSGVDTEEIFIEATKEECYDRLENDETRPDKAEWQAVIDAWFEKHSADNKEVTKMNKFWNFIRNDAGERILRLDGAISDSTWFEDDVTPAKFREELNSSDGNISVWINSPGGDCFAASQIYNMLMDYRGGSVTVKIDGIAASAASVIAMAGETVEISPTGMIMIHNPSTFAWGDADEMKAAIKMLDEVKESIINAYEIKTSLPRDKISRLMDAETWLSAHKAIELGFADKILFAENHTEDDFSAMAFSRMTVTNSLLDKIKRKKKAAPDNRVDAAQLNKRLTLIR